MEFECEAESPFAALLGAVPAAVAATWQGIVNAFDDPALKLWRSIWNAVATGAIATAAITLQITARNKVNRLDRRNHTSKGSG
jgi:hypothetical protein